MNASYKTVMMKPQDSVAVALEDIPAGAELTVVSQGQTFTVVLADPIEFGHKFAVRPIRQGDDIVKYGEAIGVAVTDIAPGQHVHVHNLEGKRGRGDLGATAG
ncbi:D-galactarate dehydratase [Gordoniibacillus kamchatkensis]|uniref:D-galactarate dehydratase n=1 Tax=Gordoniibacillus kamchatkensis TaxID=1590651 RepID=A0ABR5AGZ8_9BACL|nr:UxaA family hydrolase [Paenibacillus sp. VKM B-2647]KIL40319.1 D-galactarate dehydratase [Paenibacillus sp. VKM B-2647]